MNYPNRYNIPDELVPIVDRELASGEVAVWVGQPIPRQLARMAVPQMLFGIPWTAFAIFWTFMASSGFRKGDRSAGSWFFALWGLPFIAIGFVMLASPLSALRRAR